MSRGDLTEVEWRILKGLLPVEREPGSAVEVARPRIIATLSMAFCGGCAPARHGAMFPRSMAIGIRSIGASGDGAPPASGRAWRSLSLRRWRRAGTTTSTRTTVRAHVSAAGGKGGFINELLAARGAGSPVKFIVSAMPEAGPSPSISRRAKRRTAKLRRADRSARATPDALLADKAYESDAIRADLKARGIKAVIPPKSNRTVTIRYNKSSIENETGSSACSAISRSTAPSPRDTTNSPTASSACYASHQLVTGSNLSTPPRQLIAACPLSFHHQKP